MRLCSNCHNQPVFGTDRITKLGYCKGCQYKRTDLDRRSITVKGLEKAKKKAGWFDASKTSVFELDEVGQFSSGVSVMDEAEIEAIRKEEKILGSNELQRWFKERRNEMTGFCDNCGGKTSKDDDKYYKFSIAHLLPKAYVKSVATHPSNWLELCHFGNGCHSQMDNKMLDLIDMHCFDKIVTRVSEMYPQIAQEERRRIPSILLEYIKTEL